MSVIEAILREYAGDRWHDRIVSGEAVKEVELWLAEVETRPSLPPGASGKPLAWLCFVTGEESDPFRKKVLRSVGLLTDVLRVLDRFVTADELRQLFGTFERHGRLFTGTLEEK